MFINHDAKYLGLHEDEIARFDVLFLHDQTLQMLVRDCSLLWRERLRKIYPNPVHCRQAFLGHSIIFSAKYAIHHDSSPSDLPSMAVYICFRVEQLVRDLDAKEGNASED